MAAPRKYSLTHDHEAVATDSERTDVVGRCTHDGFVSSVRFTPVANITGAATNYRQLDLINKGQDGNGTTVIATLSFLSGVNALDYDEKAIPVTDANDAVAAGDILALASLAPGTGLADPGGQLVVEVSRSD